MARKKYAKKCIHCGSREQGSKTRGVFMCVCCGKPKYATNRIKGELDAEIKASHKKGSWGDHADMDLVCYCPELLHPNIVKPRVQCVSGAVYDRDN